MRRLIGIVLLVLLAGCNLNAPEQTAVPIPTPNIPSVEFISPTEGDRVIEGFDMTIDVVGRDETPGAGVARIEVLLNGQLLQEAIPEDDNPQPVFRVETNWITEGIGKHVLSAIAYRRDGTPSDERFISVDVIAQEG